MVRLATHNPGVPAAIDERRRRLLARVHIAAKALGIEGDDYQAVLRRVTGEASAAKCNVSQLATLVDEFTRLGFTRVDGASAAVRSASHPIARKARALWISLHQLGAIDDPSEAALEAFGRRQLGIDRLQWADQAHGGPLIEALKQIGERHGFDQSLPRRASKGERVALLRDRLVAAQLARLAALGVAIDPKFTASREDWSVRKLERAAWALGALIHEAAAR